DIYQHTAKAIRALGDVDDDERKAQLAKLNRLLKHCLAWEDARAVANCLEMARSEKGVPVLPAQLDADPWLLNCTTGTLDVRTGHLRPHRREDLLTKLAAVPFDPDAPCPQWLRFLDRIMDGNKDLINYLQRVIGYSLTGNVREQCLFFFYGRGANGKSTFL